MVGGAAARPPAARPQQAPTATASSTSIIRPLPTASADGGARDKSSSSDGRHGTVCHTGEGGGAGGGAGDAVAASCACGGGAVGGAVGVAAKESVDGMALGLRFCKCHTVTKRRTPCTCLLFEPL